MTVVPHVLIVDDEPSIGWGLSKLVERLGWTASALSHADAAIEAARHQTPDVIILDVRLPGMSGIEALPHFRQLFPLTPVIMVTAFGDLETAVEAVRRGAFEYLVKPFDLATAEKALQRALAFAAEQRRPREQPEPAVPSRELADEGWLIGKSAAMQAVFKQIALVAPSSACVHLRGESGTGKELVARAIHRYSRRTEGPFIPVNLAALNPTLVESELFGHVKGAFTGADAPRKGLLEQAHGGTIFLDEVADIPAGLQVKLLRTLEHGEIWPVGAEEPRHADFRLLSATHQDLRTLVATGTFRHDLYFRLVTFQLDLPPLRDRDDDIVELAEHFLERLAVRNHMPKPTLSAEVEAELRSRPWYGNVRELRNVMEHALILSRGAALTCSNLPPALPPLTHLTAAEFETSTNPNPVEAAAATTRASGVTATAAVPSATDQESMPAVRDAVTEWARRAVREAGDGAELFERFLALVEPPFLEVLLEQHRRQVAAAARVLGLHRSTLKKKLERYGLTSTD